MGRSASKPLQRTLRQTTSTRGTGPAGGWAGGTGQRRAQTAWGVPGAPSAGDLAREGDRAGEGKTLHGNRLMAVAGGTVRWAGGQACSHPVSERVTAPRAVWPEGQRKSPSTAQPGMPQAAQRLAGAPARPAAHRVRASGRPVGRGNRAGAHGPRPATTFTRTGRDRAARRSPAIRRPPQCDPPAAARIGLRCVAPRHRRHQAGGGGGGGGTEGAAARCRRPRATSRINPAPATTRRPIPITGR